MEWGYISVNPITNKHLDFYKEHHITHVVKNNRIYVRGSNFLETLKISTREIGKSLRTERILTNQWLLTYKTKVIFNGGPPVYGIVAASKLGRLSALMVNPLNNWAEVVPRGLIGSDF